jgi:hypothetical protein
MRDLFYAVSAFLLVGFAGLKLSLIAAQGEAAPPKAAPVRVIVGVEPRHQVEIPTVNREDVMVYEGHDRDQVTDWTAARGTDAGLEFLVLVDDSSAFSVDSQLGEIRAFINEQPPATQIGVGYMHNGMVEMVQSFTQDHAAAAKSLRLPMGAVAGAASPYLSLIDLTKHWPANSASLRREILLISSGIDLYYGAGPEDPYVHEAVQDLQRAGVVVFSIYAPGGGHLGHSYWRSNWGQNFLSQVSEETGGESYYFGFGPAVSFAPYLNQLTQQLQRQYLLSFIPKPQKKAGMQRIRVTTELSNVDLVAPDAVYVPALPEH